MANNDNQLRTLPSVESMQNEVINDVDSGMAEMQRKRKRRELDAQINKLVERAIAFEDMYGSEDYRTQIMEMFLDVTLEMKSAIDLLTDVGTALQCIGQAIGCIDDVLNMQQDILSGSLEQKYGFIERIRRRRKLRQAIRNNQSRMQQLCDMIVGSQKMAMSVVNALRKSLVKMKATTEKSFAKQRRNSGKKNAGTATEQPSLARKLMTEVRAQKGGGTGATGGAAPSAPSAPSGSTTGGTGSTSSGSGNSGGVNIDDIA